jgi:hypothetical protein
MKNKFHLATVAMTLALVFSLISCSKDKIEPAGSSGTGRASSAAVNGMAGHEFQQYDHDAVASGTLVMQVGPAEAKAIVTVYSDNYSSGPIGVNANEGMIRLENLEPGIYNVQINPITVGYVPQLITDVIITADTKTNLGTIILGY